MFKFRSFLCLTAALCLGLAVTACSPQEEVEVAPADSGVVAPDADEAPIVEPTTAPVLGGEVTEEAAPVEAAPMEAAPETIAPATMPAATAPVM